MKPRAARARRTVVAYPILALAMTGVGCTRPPNEAQPAQGETVAAVAAPTGSGTSAEPAASSAPASVPSDRAMSTDAALLALRDELQKEGREKALARTAHYRPLCDKDGYPLVGNVFRKTPERQYQPSELCAEVRKKP